MTGWNYPDDVWAGSDGAPWNRADPERTCSECVMFKEVLIGSGSRAKHVGICVREIRQSTDDDLRSADVEVVDAYQEGCDWWVEAR